MALVFALTLLIVRGVDAVRSPEYPIFLHAPFIVPWLFDY